MYQAAIYYIVFTFAVLLQTVGYSVAIIAKVSLVRAILWSCVKFGLYALFWVCRHVHVGLTSFFYATVHMSHDVASFLCHRECH